VAEALRREAFSGVNGPPLTARDVAERLGFSVDTILRWTREGKLPSHRISGTAHGRLRYFADELDAVIAERATIPAAPVREAPATHPGAADGRLLSSVPAIPPPLAASTEEEPPDATP
jgi:excisionase family DNA binding protein